MNIRNAVGRHITIEKYQRKPRLKQLAIQSSINIYIRAPKQYKEKPQIT